MMYMVFAEKRNATFKEQESKSHQKILRYVTKLDDAEKYAKEQAAFNPDWRYFVAKMLLRVEANAPLTVASFDD